MQLPPELIDQILKYLTIKEVDVCYRVDPIFHVLARSYLEDALTDIDLIEDYPNISIRSYRGILESDAKLAYYWFDLTIDMIPDMFTGRIKKFNKTMNGYHDWAVQH